MLRSLSVRILSRYYVARFLGSFLAILVASTLAIVVVDVLANLDEVLETREGLAGVVQYVLLRIPSEYLRDLVPVAAFAAAFFTFGSAARWLEITAIKSGGISPHRLLGPVLLCAAGLSLAGFVLNETVVVQASRAWNRLEAGTEASVTFRRGSFWYHKGDTVYNFSDADEATRTLRGVTVFRLDGAGRLARSIHAESVRIEDDHRWRFLDATIRDFDTERADAPVRVSHLDETVLSMESEREMALGNAEAAQLTLPELRESIAVRRREGDDVSRSVSQYHGRLASGVAVLLFVLLGAPLGFSVEQTRSMAQPALLGVGTVALFFLVRNAAATLAREGGAAGAAAPWLVVGAFATWGCVRAARIER